VAVTSIDLEPGLIEDAKRATGQRTTKGTVAVALRTVVRLARQRDAIDAIARLDGLADLLDQDILAGARR